MKKLIVLLRCVLLCSCGANTSLKNGKLSGDDIRTLLAQRAQWIYYLDDSDLNYIYDEQKTRGAEDLQNAVEHEYFLRNGAELSGDLSLYASLASEYFYFSRQEAAELLKYSSNYNSADDSITPVEDWRDEQAEGLEFIPLMYNYNNGVYDVFCQLNVWGESSYSDTSARLIFEYTDDGFVNLGYKEQNFYGGKLIYSDGGKAILFDRDSDGYLQVDFLENYKISHSILLSEQIPNSAIETERTEFAQVAIEGKTATILSNDGYIKITIDFQSGKYDVEYLLTMDDVVNRAENQSFPAIVDTKDDKTIVATAAGGGGDIYFEDLWLFADNQTTPKFLCTYGGMYGNGADCGFFKNGDVYVMTNTFFCVYENGVNAFNLGDVFPLGDNGDDSYTYVNAVRRNEDGTFTILYCTLVDGHVDYENGQADSNYILTTIDTDGNRIKTVDTGEKVRVNHFGLLPVNMYLENENTIHFEVKFKDELIAKKDIVI